MTAATIEVVYQHLPGDITGLYDHETRTIYLDPRCDYATRNSTLSHELKHAARGDTRCDDPWFDAKQELTVERAAAKDLIPFTALESSVLWCMNSHEMADHLDVDHSMLLTRIQTLTPDEHDALRGVVATLERTA